MTNNQKQSITIDEKNALLQKLFDRSNLAQSSVHSVRKVPSKLDLHLDLILKKISDGWSSRRLLRYMQNRGINIKSHTTIWRKYKKFMGDSK